MISGVLALLVLPAAAGGTPAGPPLKVERRLLVKDHRLFLNLGPTYFGRDDYHQSPGAGAALAYYLDEDNGLELRGAWFFSTLSAAGAEVFRRTGLVPDAPRPRAFLTLGWRRSIAYGKVLAGGAVLHFDFQGALHGGVLATDRGAAPAAMLAPGVMVRLTQHLVAQLDVAVVASVESRGGPTLSLGVLPALSLGAAW